ncbi:hypothetical protein BH10BAC5_BH10BAC5_00680 [soil metagenome]
MKLNFLILFFLLSGILHAASTPADFFNALISDSDDLRSYVEPTELARSERLRITYTGVKNKFILANDIQENVKEEIRKGNLKYEIHESPLEDNYSIVYIVILQLNDSLRFYFHEGKYTSPTSYLTKNWKTSESKYFRFKISEPIYFNDYCLERLDRFAEMLLDSLGVPQDERELLQTNKLYYIFCSDEKEVGKVTGIRSKGQAFLAFDEIITAYQTHFHEVAHLLINFKLKTLGLFTLPFFQEGFAVAMGGRGGMAPRVVTDIGYYLQKTNFVTYDSILTYNAFINEDPGSSYAVAGLYNKFLIDELGMKKYLELYKKVNGNLDFVKDFKTVHLDLPFDFKFDQFLSDYNFDKDMKFYNKKLTISEQGLPKYSSVFSIGYSRYYFYIFESKSFFDIRMHYPKNERYISRICEELKCDLKNKKSYLFVVDSSSIMIYNCLNDELVCYYDKNFSIEHTSIPEFNKSKLQSMVIEVNGRVFNDPGAQW